MRLALLALLALVCVAAAATGAGGRSAVRPPTLTFKEVTLDGKRGVLSRHAIDPYTYSLSPDHKQLAYIAQQCVGCRATGVWVADVRRPGERVLLDTGCQSGGVSWAPNGQVHGTHRLD